MSDDDTYFSNDSATFGDRVAAAREAQGLKQDELAKKLGVKLKTVRGWEDDVDEPRANKLSMLSGMLNVSMRWLLTGEGNVGPKDEPRETKLRRLKMRSMRRGIKEMDLILGGFAAKQLDALSDADLSLYDEMLSESDHDMYQWASGQMKAPAKFEELIQRAVAGAKIF
ncbi:Succinate dehydrogenase assembly factor 2, mitochondrial [Nymphon striatum]|nr:Succinate dehydrogenase assembly factor 2, mitochondrial [Nymphon striatum]